MGQWHRDGDADQTLAKALQKEIGSRDQGLNLNLPKELQGPVTDNRGGGSDDIGDVSWNVPTVTLRYPANIPGLPGHNWANAIAMATPIAHKGATAGAKVLARTALEMFLTPRLVESAQTYFRDVQTRDTRYTSFITAQDPPAIWLNAETMEEFKPKLQPFYYDETRYGSYLEQLGIQYPQLRRP